MHSIATSSRCCSLWPIEPCKVIQLNVKGEVTFVATKCGDILTPLHLQAGLHYSRVTQVWCCTRSSLLLMLALLWWYIKWHKLGLYVSHATTPPWLKCTCTPPQWSLERKFIYLYTVPCYSVQHFSCLQVKSWIFPYTSVYDPKVKVTQYIQARFSGVTSV